MFLEGGSNFSGLALLKNNCKTHWKFFPVKYFLTFMQTTVCFVINGDKLLFCTRNMRLLSASANIKRALTDMKVPPSTKLGLPPKNIMIGTKECFIISEFWIMNAKNMTGVILQVTTDWNISNSDLQRLRLLRSAIRLHFGFDLW